MEKVKNMELRNYFLTITIVSSLLMFAIISCKKEEVQEFFIKYTLDGKEYYYKDGIARIENSLFASGGINYYQINLDFSEPYGTANPVLPTFHIYFMRDFDHLPNKAEKSAVDKVGRYEYNGQNGYASNDTTMIQIRMWTTDSVEYRTKGDTSVFDPAAHYFYVVTDEPDGFLNYTRGTFSCVLYKRDSAALGIDSFTLTKGQYRAQTWGDD